MKRALPIIGWVFIALALATSFAVDFHNCTQGGAIDLRNRITGVRVLEHNLDPYRYKWHAGDLDRYCDVYNNPSLPVSKTTVTPTMLLLHTPYAAVPYREGQFLWLFTQWALLLATGMIWWCASPKPWQRRLAVSFVVAFSYTGEWRLHAERGQSYIVLTFALSLWLALTLHRRWGNSFLAGFIAGLLVALRPPFLLLGPFLALHRRGQLIGAVAGLTLALVLPMLFRLGIWDDYCKAVQINAGLYLTQDETRPGQQHYPAQIEGTPTDLVAGIVPLSYSDFSIHAILNRFGLGPFPGWPFEVVAVGLFAAWLWFTRGQSAEKLLPGLVASFFLIDLCLPVYRQSYNDVLALAIIGCAFATATRIPWALAAAVVALVAGWYVAYTTPDEKWLINLPATCYVLMSFALLFFIDNRWAFRKG